MKNERNYLSLVVITLVGLSTFLFLMVGAYSADSIVNNFQVPSNNNACNSCNSCEKKPEIKYRTRYVTVPGPTKTITKVVYKKQKTKVKVKVKKVYRKTKKNSVSLIGGISSTNLKTRNVPGGHIAETHYEADLGILLQRDISRTFRASAIGTSRGSMYIGIGFNF